ncbi:Gfo/Idh/MocA family oxidoreductase [Microbacterium betulae]|uniref:Gfo/Idh/MocA family oxidoreductase n=1 Tax=Microbacterium betulae TaxID=2981139 RepID=A0AA97I7E2_9MICO|nr:Gfo/Idh/MocA family oxidoreductase [Microbacterium sp. AB]WOF23340.1 Gfo/Idh/MocA family oxidoreductase [Microbacterium sp. AB]
MTGSGRVGVGIVGAGTISDQYLENLTAFGDLDVRFVADVDTARAASQAGKWGVPATGSYDELLADDGIEIVVNLTIPAAHVEVALRAVQAGRHVWGEKPYALDRTSARRLAAAARRRGVRVAVAPDTFLGAGLQTALRAVREGEIGEPLTALTLFQIPGPESWHPSPEFLYAKGGGPLFDVGPYYLTALVQVLGAVSRVSAASSRARRSRVIGSGPKAGTPFPVEVPTHVGALIEFAGGGSAQSIFSFDSPLRRAGLVEFAGTRGTVVFPDPNEFDGDTVVWGADGESRTIPANGSRYTRGTGVLELARAIRADRAERVPGALALHVLDVMTSIVESADLGRPVEVASRADPSPLLEPGWDPASSTL